MVVASHMWTHRLETSSMSELNEQKGYIPWIRMLQFVRLMRIQ